MEMNTTRRAFLQTVAMAPLGYRLLTPRAPMRMLDLYVGTYTDGESKGIYRCRMNADSGAVEIVDVTEGIANPSYLAVDPSGKYLYSVGETTDFGDTEAGGVYAYAVDPSTKSLRKLNAQPSHGGAPCYVSVTADGGHVLVANYVGGNVAIYPILHDGRLGAAADVEQHAGSGANERRQKGPHAHCILPHDGFAFAVDLGIDKVIVYRVDGGKLVPHSEASVAPGAGPRHIAFHPNGHHAYVINELDSTLTSFAYVDGELSMTQTIRTLPEDFEGESYCADVHVSADGRFVYGSNRGHDSIVVFSIHPETGALSAVQHVSTGGSWPRNFALDSSGRFLLVANQRTDDIVIFAVDASTGRLTPSGQVLDLPSPVCLRFL